MEHIKKPEWLKIKIGGNDNFAKTKKLLEAKGLHTICSSGKCPNIGECWNRGTATFMIGGDICTRSCKFCNTKTGKPTLLDSDEPLKVAQSIQTMSIKHAVITSVDRDDLPDLGAEHWVNTIKQVRLLNPETKIEILIPDFQGESNLISQVCLALPDIAAHNMETVKRLTPLVRSAAKYETSLNVLKIISEHGIKTKSGIMLGLGETLDEVNELMDDLRKSGCEILTIGQYLQPTRKHLPVKEYIHPDVFLELKIKALEKSFTHVESGPLVRSSYHADNIL